MSIREILAGGGAVKSIQTGYVFEASPASGAGQDSKYVDVTISSVNTNKAMVLPPVGGNQSAESTSWGNTRFAVAGRLISSTTLRIHTGGGSTAIAAAWTVVEYN